MVIFLENRLTIDEIRSILFEGATLKLSDKAKENISKSYEFLKSFSSDKVISLILSQFSNAKFEIILTFDKSISSSEVQSAKAPSPMVSRPRARVTFSRDVHPLKAPASRVCTALGKDRDVREVHPSKAPSPICVQVSGIDTLSREVHPLNT